MEMEDLHESIARCHLQIEAFFQNNQSIPELNQLQSTNPPTTAGKQIEIILNGSFDHLTPELQNAVVRAIAAILEISPDQVTILKAMFGSSREPDIALRESSHETQPIEERKIADMWSQIKRRLQNDKERLIIHASFFLGLSPREIHQQNPNIFESVEEIYQCKANVLARLGRDLELRDLFTS